jgi:hypothetical protein
MTNHNNTLELKIPSRVVLRAPHLVTEAPILDYVFYTWLSMTYRADNLLGAPGGCSASARCINLLRMVW